jgi:hypothetical protein
MGWQETAKLGDGEEYALTGASEMFYDPEHDAKIVANRVKAFVAYGFTDEKALVLAENKAVDREQVARMIRQGATPAQVYDIVL